MKKYKKKKMKSGAKVVKTKSGRKLELPKSKAKEEMTLNVPEVRVLEL